MDRRPPATIRDEDDDETPELTFSSRSCCCFFIPSSSWERISHSSSAAAAASRSSWWRACVKAFVAGPKWKTFARRFNRKKHHHHHQQPPSYATGNHHRRNGSFGYDPLSYKMNFDGGDRRSFDRGVGYPDFSTRFAAPPALAKPSMDLGGKYAPPLFAPAAVAG